MKYTCISKTSNRIFMLQIERYLLGMLTLLSCIKITYYTNSTQSTKLYFIRMLWTYVAFKFSCFMYIFLYAKILPKIYKKATRLEFLVWKSLTKLLLTKIQPQIVQPKCGFVYYNFGCIMLVFTKTNYIFVFI